MDAETPAAQGATKARNIRRLIPPPPDPAEDETDAWLLTYADAVTLLMAFFIILVSFSKIDIPVYEEVKAGILNELGKKGDEDREKSPTSLLKTDLQEVLFALQADQAVAVGMDERGVVMELDSSAFFGSGSAEIRAAAEPILVNTAKTLLAPRYEAFAIEVEGHTDDDPISTAVFPSNWELSAGRASAVVRFFVAQGLNGDKMKAVGYGDTRPKVANRDAQGAPIPENQAINRRVVIRIFPMSLDERDAYFERRSREAIAAGRFAAGRPESENPPPGR